MNNNVKLKISREFFKDIKNYFLLPVFVIFIWQWNSILDLIIYNLKAFLLIFVPSAFIFIWKWKRTKDNESFDKKSLLTTASIIIAVLFFIFKNFEINTNRIDSIRVANHYNCGIALGNINLPNSNGDRYSLSYFIIEPYKENLEFAIKYPEILDFTFLQKIYIKMESVNSIMRLVEELNVPGADPLQSVNIQKIMIERNKDIANQSKVISELVCKNLLTKNENFEYYIRKFLINLKIK